MGMPPPQMSKHAKTSVETSEERNEPNRVHAEGTRRGGRANRVRHPRLRRRHRRPPCPSAGSWRPRVAREAHKAAEGAHSCKRSQRPQSRAVAPVAPQPYCSNGSRDDVGPVAPLKQWPPDVILVGERVECAATLRGAQHRSDESGQKERTCTSSSIGSASRWPLPPDPRAAVSVSPHELPAIHPPRLVDVSVESSPFRKITLSALARHAGRRT